MWAFLQTYGSWIIFGALMLLMFRMHAGGHGCGGMAHHGDEDEPSAHRHEGYVVDADPPGARPTTRWPVATGDEGADADRPDGGLHSLPQHAGAAVRGDTHQADRERTGHTGGCH